MKTCPFCAEEIQDKAIKCRWCGEFLPEEKIEETSKSPVEEKKAAETPKISSHNVVQEELKREIGLSTIETIQLKVDGKIVEVSRWYKDLNENQKSAVNDKVLLWKVLGILFPGISLLRARCYGYFALLLLVSLGFGVVSEFNGQPGIVVIPRIIATILIFMNLGTWGYNRSKGNLHKVAYNAHLNNHGFMTDNQEVQVIKNSPMQEIQLDEKKETVKETTKVIDLYSLSNGSDEMNIIEKEVSNTNSDGTEENNFPIWVIPVIIFFLYFIFQALKNS